MLNSTQDTDTHMTHKTAISPPIVKPRASAMPRLLRYVIGTLILLSGSAVLLMNAFNSF
ncbi:hypothetical protein [Alkanindiges illinoisensis]|uniref:hypothetical protein n=1 Tax=Alkanindiges illinoisensis TaxID=197183 RepID=UPI0012EC7363|nr:hypothetical protein [Alkanindiges illinoisensis]